MTGYSRPIVFAHRLIILHTNPYAMLAPKLCRADKTYRPAPSEPAISVRLDFAARAEGNARHHHGIGCQLRALGRSAVRIGKASKLVCLLVCAHGVSPRGVVLLRELELFDL